MIESEKKKIPPSPEEDRTPDLRISWHGTAYKYDALTDCATGEHTVTAAPYHNT